MEFLDLGSGIKMPIVGLGTWQSTDEVMERALNDALEIGYRHFDTSPLYGNEKIIGSVLKNWISNNKIRRQEIFITTKLPPMGMHSDLVGKFLKESLESLQLDYVDLYLIHSPNRIHTTDDKTVEEETNVDHIPIWKAMEKQVEQGFAKSIGISNFSREQIESILKHAVIRPSNLQIELHVYYQQKELVQFCFGNRISVVAYSPLGSPGIENFYENYGIKKDVPKLLENPIVLDIGNRYNKSAAQIILKYTVQSGIAIIPKSTSRKRLEENFSLFDFKLNDDDMKILLKLDLGEKGRIAQWDGLTNIIVILSADKITLHYI